MNKTIVFPGGAGGNWLLYLIYQLQRDIKYPVNFGTNFHSLPKPDNIGLSHNHDLLSDKYTKFLNGTSFFNIYLNVMYKLRLAEQQIFQLPIDERFELMAGETSTKLFFIDKPMDLQWEDIFNYESRFIDSFYDLMNTWSLEYIRNDSVIINSIAVYKKTCIDPSTIFDNFENELWLGWCTGILKHELNDWPIINSMEQAQDFLYPKRSYFYDYTADKILLYNKESKI